MGGGEAGIAAVPLPWRWWWGGWAAGSGRVSRPVLPCICWEPWTALSKPVSSLASRATCEGIGAWLRVRAGTEEWARGQCSTIQARGSTRSEIRQFCLKPNSNMDWSGGLGKILLLSALIPSPVNWGGGQVPCRCDVQSGGRNDISEAPGMMPGTRDALLTVTRQVPAGAWKVGEAATERTTGKLQGCTERTQMRKTVNSEEGIVRVGRNIWRRP